MAATDVRLTISKLDKLGYGGGLQYDLAVNLYGALRVTTCLSQHETATVRRAMDVRAITLDRMTRDIAQAVAQDVRKQLEEMLP